MGRETCLVVGYGFIFDELLYVCEDCQKYAELINNNFHKEAEEYNYCEDCNKNLPSYFDECLEWNRNEEQWLFLTKGYNEDFFTYSIYEKYIWNSSLFTLNSFLNYKNEIIKDEKSKKLIQDIDDLAKQLNVKAEWFVKYEEFE
jgi:hypothetical protein